MAETEEKSVSIPWLSLITLVGLGSGVFFFFPQLISSRPGGGESQLSESTFDHQMIAARLWQDPLGVAIADREKNVDRVGDGARAEERLKEYRDSHSVGEFQKLVIQKCFAKSANYLLDGFFSQEPTNQVHILAVMIPGGPYVEDVERRLRSRRAVIEGLAIAGYDPEMDDEIGYFYVPWQPLAPDVTSSVDMLEKKRTEDENRPPSTESWVQPVRSNSDASKGGVLPVPYEWFVPQEVGAKDAGVNGHLEHVLVLWLIDNSFRDAPLERLADLISWFRLRTPTSVPQSNLRLGNHLDPPVFRVLGPDNSGTLQKMVVEAAKNPWSNKMRQCLAKTHIYSSQASAAESQLLSEVPATQRTLIPFARVDNCKELIERNVKQQRLGSGFSFDRAVLPDDKIVKTMWQELENRGVRKSDLVAIISEEDTFYARALSSTFWDLRPEGSLADNISLYTYLRGIDGKLPSDGKDEKEIKDSADSTDKNTRSSSSPTDKPEGLNQADGIRRLAERLQELDKKAQKNSGGRASLKAVGLLGSDVYDKLELLKALHPVLPGAVFFTNNLDARLFHPDEWNETHNLVVVSSFQLFSPPTAPQSTLPPKSIQISISKFRDSAQTALFEATLLAMEPNDAAPSVQTTPLIFEIGRNGPKELKIPEDKVATLGKLYVSESKSSWFGLLVAFLVKPPDSLQSYLLRITCLVAIGILLLAWIRSVSRVTCASSKAKFRA